MRKIARTDSNQEGLVKIWRSLGVSVWITSQLGNGAPDVVLGFPGGLNVMVEIKDGNKIPFRQRLTLDEEKFHANWLGDIRIIRSEQEAIDLVNEMRKKCS